MPSAPGKQTKIKQDLDTVEENQASDASGWPVPPKYKLASPPRQSASRHGMMRGYGSGSESATHSDAESDAVDGMARRAPSAPEVGMPKLTADAMREAERMTYEVPARALDTPPKDAGRTRDADAMSDVASVADSSINTADELREAKKKWDLTEANSKYKAVSDTWDREHQGLAKEEKLIMKKYAADEADLALIKQMSITKISKEADEKKCMWHEYERRMRHNARVEYEIRKEDIDENVKRGLMQADAPG